MLASIPRASSALLPTLALGLLVAVAPVAAGELPPLPEGLASFGGAVSGDHLYVYGGHVGGTHEHSIENLSHRFRRLDLTAENPAWEVVEELDRPLQGLPLVAHGGRVCRVGGLSARNHAGEEEDLVSVAEAACYAAGDGWKALPPMPSPRSSHDAAVLGDHLYVVGGWQLRGRGREPVWRDTALRLDLSAASPGWEEIPQPFGRRALSVAAAGGKVYALGGLTADGTSRRVDVYDPATKTWSAGPELPEMSGRMKGFGVSAFGVGDRVYLSGADGRVHVLTTADGVWHEGRGRLGTPRFFHRLLPHGDELLFVGGASREGHLDGIETLSLDELEGEAGAAGEDPAGEDSAGEIAAWPGFRGRGDGHTTAEPLPARWSADDNVAWRAALPGYGQSSPVVWGGQVFVTSVEGPRKEELILSALDLADGTVRWRRRFDASQEIENTDMVSRAAPTPAVDGERVYAFWESGDVVAVGHDGETVWSRSLTDDYGPSLGNHGVGSSPVLVPGEPGALVVQVTHDGPSYFVALDRATGETRWKADREPGVAWTTPLVTTGDGGGEIVSSAAGRVEALDPATGETLWSHGGLKMNRVPSAVLDGDLLVVASSEVGESFALRTAAGTSPEVAWRTEGVAAGFPSPVVRGECVLFVNKAGVASCLDRADGRKLWSQRLAGEVWASPIVAGDRVFFFGKDGATSVLRVSRDGAEVLAENALAMDGPVYGAATVPGAVVLRSASEVVRVGRPAVETASPE